MIKQKLYNFYKKNQFILIIGLISFAFFPLLKYWKKHPFMNDVDQYYSYLVAVFIKNDLTFQWPNPYWLHQSPLNIMVQKMSIGLSILYSPLFLISHGIALIFNVNPNGYSTPYGYSIALGTIVYILIGLHYLRKTLLSYFPLKAVNLTIISIYFGTNLLFYTVGWGLMSHSYLFFMMCIVIYCTHSWYQSHKIKHIILIGFFMGLITVSRPIEIIFALFPLLFGVQNFTDVKNRIIEWWNYRLQLIISFLFFTLPIFPQLLYWKKFAGSWIYFSYHNEKFYFSNPHVFEVLFSFRKGLFVYTPIIILSFIGILFSYKKKYFWSTILYVSINLFLVSSWWCWWYGGSYGMRALTQSFAVLSFPMAYIITYIFSKNTFKKIGLTIIYLLIGFSLTQTYQFSHHFIHWDSMTKKAYIFSLFNFKYNPDERAYFNSVLEEPDYDSALKGLPEKKAK